MSTINQADMLRAAAEEFCRRVEAGEVLSRRSYAAFKAALAAPPAPAFTVDIGSLDEDQLEALGRWNTRLGSGPLVPLPAAPADAVPFAVRDLITHIDDVLPDEAFAMIDTTKWNAVTRLLATTPAASPDVLAEPVAWMNRPVLTGPDNNFAGYGEWEVGFKRLSYGYDWTGARPLFDHPTAQADRAALATLTRDFLTKLDAQEALHPSSKEFTICTGEERLKVWRECRESRAALDAAIDRLAAAPSAQPGEDWARCAANPTIPHTKESLRALTELAGIRVCIDPAMPDGTVLLVYNGKVVGTADLGEGATPA